MPALPPEATANSRWPHLLPMRVGQAEIDRGYLLSGLASFVGEAVIDCGS